MNLSVKDLSFSYNHRDIIFEKVSFSVKAGDVLCVLGPNGAGKSTLFKCILGRYHDYSGVVTIDNKDIREFNKREISGCLAYIPQYFANVYDYTVEELVLMGTARTMGPVSSPKEEQLIAAREALRQLGILNLADKLSGSISGGERQLAYIARALAQNARIFIMDEPTSALDLKNRIRVLNHIKSLKNDGYSIILSTHDPDIALNYSNKILALKDKKMSVFGDTREILTEELLCEIYEEPLGILEAGGRRLSYLKESN